MRRIGYRVVAGVFALAVAAEGVAHAVEDSVAPHRMHSLAHVLASLVLLAGLVTQLGRRPSPAGLGMIAATGLAAGFGDLTGWRFGGLEVIALVAVVVLVAVSPERALLVARRRFDRPMLVGAVLVALAGAPYVLAQAQLQRAGSADDGYYSWAAAAAVLPALLLALSSTGLADPRLPAWFAVAGLVAVGGLSLALPAEPSSLGTAGGATALVLAAVVGCLAVLSSRTVRIDSAAAAAR